MRVQKTELCFDVGKLLLRLGGVLVNSFHCLLKLIFDWVFLQKFPDGVFLVFPTFLDFLDGDPCWLRHLWICHEIVVLLSFIVVFILFHRVVVLALLHSLHRVD